MIGMNDSLLMDLAINKAWEYQVIAYPNPAVGALITDAQGAIIALEAHQKSGTSHAEVLALLKAYEHLSKQKVDIDPLDSFAVHNFLLQNAKDIFHDCSIYVTLEPCSHLGQTPSCASLLVSLALKRVVIATVDPISTHSGGVEMLKAKGIEVLLGVQESRAKILLEPFRIWQKRAFVLFKVAQSHNGKIGGGYLSSQDSLKHTHKIRNVASKMLIGGNTVRLDRPTLDCRLLDSAKAPDIHIYSKHDNFDREIPLFSVPNRSVEIGSDVSFLDRPSMVLIEGGEGTLRTMHEHIDWVLTYQIPKISDNGVDYRANIDLETLHTQASGVDRMIWSRLKHTFE
jgi:diaminohydroxyphosphoribosylaminopyrimidine deaminase/5-amino-6-(5-phosphoribosylamino)uracil reductase